MRRFAILSIVLALLSGGCGGSDGPTLGDARTYYEALDFSSPAAGAETFVDAFASDDFMTVFLALDLEAEFTIQQNHSLLQYRRLLRRDLVADFPNEVIQALSPNTMETTEMWYVFDRIMQIAKRHDAFLIDLSGQVTLDATETSDVLASVEGIEGEVVIRMTESPGGNWRVHQVIVPGGDEELIPWSVPDGSQ